MDNNEQKIRDLGSENTGFRREISLFGGISIIGGIMVGSGIFYLGSYVLMRSGMSQGLALLCWIIGGVVSLLGGLCYAELGTSIPKAGGGVVYLSEAYHPVVGFLSGFNSWVIGGPGSISALAIALPTALAPHLGFGDMG
ncbi:MAG: amino acid permease, partial [Firmicutes bacterium]|nr:amino acid permease [Bacillota bacterium]